MEIMEYQYIPEMIPDETVQNKDKMKTNKTNITGDKVAQLVRCRTSNQELEALVQFPAGALWSVLGQDSLFHTASVYPASKWVPSINKAVIRACALYAASCYGISPGGLKWFPCVQCLLGEEGGVSASVDTKL